MPTRRVSSYEELLESAPLFVWPLRVLFGSALLTMAGLAAAFLTPFPGNLLGLYLSPLAFLIFLRGALGVSGKLMSAFVFIFLLLWGGVGPVLVFGNVYEQHQGATVPLIFVGYFLGGWIFWASLNDMAPKWVIKGYARSGYLEANDLLELAAYRLVGLLGALVAPAENASFRVSRLLKGLGVGVLRRKLFLMVARSSGDLGGTTPNDLLLRKDVEQVVAGADMVGLPEARERLFLFFVSVVEKHPDLLDKAEKRVLAFLNRLGQILGLGKGYTKARIQALRREAGLTVEKAASMLGMDLEDLTLERLEEAFHGVMSRVEPHRDEAADLLAARERLKSWLDGKR